MKKLLYLSLLILGLGAVNSAKAQISVNVNIGSQPLWGPVGYDYARYYYIPEIDVYYDVSSRHYTYYHGNRWITRSRLPGNYRNFDIYRSYKVVINDRDPWRNHSRNRRSYGRYANNYSQVILRDSRRDGRHDGYRDRDRYDRDRYDGRHGHYDKKSQKRYEKEMRKHNKRHDRD